MELVHPQSSRMAQAHGALTPGHLGATLNPLSILAKPHPVPIAMGTVSVLPAFTERTALLGACVVVVLRCHQLVAVARYELPGPPTRRTLRSCWFSQQALEMLEYKFSFFNLPWAETKAELYGGGAPLPSLASEGPVGARNVAAARAWLRSRGLRIQHEDVGGKAHRLLVLRDGLGFCTPLPPSGSMTGGGAAAS